jgi:hypothetical protein
MALNDDTYKTALIGLYAEMAAHPMSIDAYAERMATINDTQIKTGEVKAGIPVSTQGSATQQTGQTTAAGVIQ